MKYRHTCTACHFLGSYKPKSLFDKSYSSEFDLFFCPLAGLKRGGLVARYGNKENDMIECLVESVEEKQNVFESINEAFFRYKAKQVR